MSILSQKNDYIHVRVRDDKTGQAWPVLRAICAHCDETADVKISRGSSTCDQAFADKMFRNKKWDLGKDRQHDTCPECVEKQKAALRAARETSKTPANSQMDHEVNRLVKLLAGHDNIAPATKRICEQFLRPIRGWTPEMLQLVEDTIREHIKKLKTGSMGFPPGWSDKRVVQEVCTLPEFEGLHERTISAFRTALYGPARITKAPVAAPQEDIPQPKAALAVEDRPMPVPVPARSQAVEARLAALEERLQEVEDREDELRGVVFKLLDNVGKGASTAKLVAVLQKALADMS